MPRMSFAARRFGRPGLAAFPALLLSSAAPLPVDYAVVRAYEREYSVASDCSLPYFPIPGEVIEVPGYALGEDAPVMMVHRSMPVTSSLLHTKSREDMAPGAVEFWYDGEDLSYGQTAVPTATGGCTRVMVRVDKNPMGVALTEGTISTTDKWFTHFGVSTRGNNDVTQRAQPRDTANIVAMVYENGNPVRDGRPITLKSVAWGVPGNKASTISHEHVAVELNRRGPDAVKSTLRIDNRPGNTPITKATDSKGEVKATVLSGYRGGVEGIVATARVGGKETQAHASVVLRVRGGLVHISRFIPGFDNNTLRRAPTPQFPFLLGGEREGVHFYNHFVNARMGPQIITTLRNYWNDDQARHQGRRFLSLDDISVEGGGWMIIRNNSGHCGYDTKPDLPHRSHTAGLDFDISPCYTNGGHIKSSTCERLASNRNSPHLLNVRRLYARVVEEMGGAIYVHGESNAYTKLDGAPFHYHIRFPLR